jgi:Ca2+-binding RTX toxin-like protein
MRKLVIATALALGAAGAATVAAPATAAGTTPTTVAPARGTVVECHGVRATIVGTPSSDVLRGTAGRDVIAGLDGNDRIHAGRGNDLVCGGDGADQLYGGAGKDRLYGQRDLLQEADEDGLSRSGDTLRGGPGDDRLSAGADHRSADEVFFDVISWDASAHGVHIDLRSGTARGEGVDHFVGGTFSVVGSKHADVVDGTDRRDRIDTGAGPDVVRADGGSDIINVDSTRRGHDGNADRVWGGNGDDRISARHGEDHLAGGPGDDWIDSGGVSNDVLLGGTGNDFLTAQIGDTRGPQRFNGGPGNDGIQVNTDEINPKGAPATADWDMASGDLAFTLVDTTSLSVLHIERAVLAARATAWTVTGTPGDDSVFGDANSVSSPVIFDGLAGDDSFRGTDGDDVFDGGDGQDHSYGMFDGDDTCLRVEVIDGSDCEHVTP